MIYFLKIDFQKRINADFNMYQELQLKGSVQKSDGLIF
jgi:hypothetical protein